MMKNKTKKPKKPKKPNTKTRKNRQKNKPLTKILYKGSIFPPALFRRIQQECQQLHPFLKPDFRNAAKVTTNRTHVLITDPNSGIVKTFYGPAFLKRLGKMTGFSLAPSALLPIEYRHYGIGSSMKWHRDSIVTQEQNPQIEVVFTVHNNSDSTTEWIEEFKGEKGGKGKKHVVQSQPNTIMVTQGNSVYHQVTPITHGERTIIKIAYDVKES